jgi:hypothetical protein
MSHKRSEINILGTPKFLMLSSHQLMHHNYKLKHAHANTAPKSVEQQLQQSIKIVRLINIGVLEEVYSSELASQSPILAIPKKSGSSTMRVVTDLRKLNLFLKHHPFPISKILFTPMIRSIEVFNFASEL